MAYLTYRSAGLLCSLVALALYSNTLDCGLCFDDQAAIVTNMDLRPNVSWFNLLQNDFWGVDMSSKDSHKSYRPLCVATFRLNYLFHELQPMGYHLVNILLHGAVCYLYVQLCGLVFSQVWPALIAGLLFAVHPIHTEAVAGVVGRADVLSGVFFLLTLLIYHKSVVSKGTSSYMWLMLSLTVVLCGCLSKELGLTVVGVGVVYEYVIIRQMTVSSTFSLLRTLREKSSRHGWLGQFLVRVSVLGLFAVIFLIMRIRLNQGPPIFSILNNPALFFPTPYRQLHWGYLTTFNLKLLFSPGQLCAEYAMSTIPPIETMTDIRNFITLITFVAIGLFVFYSVNGSSRCKRVTMFGLSLIVFPYLPASNLFFPVGFVVAERVLYLPSMGTSLLVAYRAWKVLKLTQDRPIMKSLVTLSMMYVLVSYSIKTVDRNRDWFSSYTLFLSGVQVTPHNSKLINNLGASLKNQSSLTEQLFRYGSKIEPLYINNWMNLAETLRESDQPMEAIEAYQIAAELVTMGTAKVPGIHVTPGNVKVFNSLSNMLREHTDNDSQSLLYANKAISYESNWANGYHSRGKILMKMNRYKEAKPSLLEAVRINPDFSLAHSNLGETLFKLGQLKEAEVHLRRSLNLDPDYGLTMFRLANLIVHMDHTTVPLLREAEQLLLEVLEVEPTNGNATFCLGLVYFDLRDYPLAEERFVQALNISEGHSGSLYNLGIILTTQKRYSEAVVYLEQLISLNPDHLNGLSQLGTCYLRLNLKEKAVETFSRVLEKDPNHLQALQNLGVTMVQDNNKKRAIELFSRLVALNPADEAIKQQLDVLKQN